MKTIVPEGYQETKLGFVPKDWNIVKLRDIATKCTKKILMKVLLQFFQTLL